MIAAWHGLAAGTSAAMPSPTTAVWHLFGIPIRAYALCILLGIAVAIWITDRRLQDRGEEPGRALDIAMYAVVAGIIGGRLYHVVTTPQPYKSRPAAAAFSAAARHWSAVASIGKCIDFRQSFFSSSRLAISMVSSSVNFRVV